MTKADITTTTKNKRFELMLLSSLSADERRRNTYKAIYDNLQQDTFDINYKKEAKTTAKFFALTFLSAFFSIPFADYD